MAGTCLTTFLSGDILKGVTCVWTNMPGNIGQWFYPLLLVGLQAAIYGKTQNMTTTLVTGLLVSTMMVGAGLYTGSAGAMMSIPIAMFIFNFALLIGKVVFKL